MDYEKLVESYLCAWNRRDIAGLLALMHSGAAYYDAFWGETCAGRDLKQYFNDWFQSDPHYYRKKGDVIEVEGGVVFRYSAHEWSDSEVGQVAFEGAEILTVRDGMILTVTDHYCATDPSELKEAARLSQIRHGLPKYATSGLGAGRSLFVRRRFADLLDPHIAKVNAEMTVAQLATKIGCKVDHLIQVINEEYKSNFSESPVRHSKSQAEDVLNEIMARHTDL